MKPTEDRYSRQRLFAEIGDEGQTRVRAGHAVVVGLGALGCPAAALLVRAGVGHVTLIDRDIVEWTNLQRQTLFTEHDAANGSAKSAAAATALGAANSDVRLTPHVRDLDSTNVDLLLADADVVVDGTDNFAVRFLINDWCVRESRPWIYAAAVGANGLLMPVLPGTTPCLRCVFESPPPAGSTETCDTAGVLGPVTSIVGALAALEALKIVAGRRDAVRRGLLSLDLWPGDIRSIDMQTRRDDCPCCGARTFPFLERRPGGATALCGRDAVQVTPTSDAPFEFESVRQRLTRVTEVRDAGSLLRFDSGGLTITLFEDGRAIVHGTHDESRARSVYDRLVGT